MAESTQDAEDRVVEFIEVYRCNLELEANRVVDELLAPAEIAGIVHDRSSRMMPAPMTGTGSFFVAVPGLQANTARELLRQAHLDGELDSSSGQVLG